MCKIIALTGPSSVGKTSLLNTIQTLADTLVNIDLKYTRIKKVITNTDRKPRPKEEDKVDYNFLTKDKFNELIEKDKLIEYIESLGGKVVSAISNKVNYLINNDKTSTSTKNTKAKELNISIISEEDFRNLSSK